MADSNPWTVVDNEFPQITHAKVSNGYPQGNRLDAGCNILHMVNEKKLPAEKSRSMTTGDICSQMVIGWRIRVCC